CESIFSFSTGKYDTILLLMNGIGLAGTFHRIPKLLRHLKTLLTKNGQIICDSTDIRYLFEDEPKESWHNSGREYYGNFRFNMRYKESESGWFDWVYIDLENFRSMALDCGLSLSLLENIDESYLVKLENLKPKL